MEMALAYTEDGEHMVFVTLSRRNLLALLAKLDGFPASSAAAIVRDTDAGRIVVTAEEDARHYADREPGLMHPVTAARIEGFPDRLAPQSWRP